MIPAELFDLTGKVAVVTGGSRGIGLAMVEGFAAAGADVVIASRKLDRCEAVAEQVRNETGRRALAVACHVGEWTACSRLVDVVYDTFGACDILVNDAGMSPHFSSLAEVTEAYWDKVTSVNLKGPFRLGALAGARMAAAGGGSIINVGTIGSLRPRSNELVYACAKAGLNALTVGLADAYGPHVRCNAILPGGVATDISAHWTAAQVSESTRDVPLRRLGTPADFVGVALWLASAASAWVTGEIVRVDGGNYRQTS